MTPWCPLRFYVNNGPAVYASSPGRYATFVGRISCGNNHTWTIGNAAQVIRPGKSLRSRPLISCTFWIGTRGETLRVYVKLAAKRSHFDFRRGLFTCGYIDSANASLPRHCVNRLRTMRCTMLRKRIFRPSSPLSEKFPLAFSSS